MGFQRWRFVRENIPIELVCSICEGVLKNPIQCKACKAMFCLKCLDDRTVIEEDINAFDVVVVWLNPPSGQGYAPPPPKTVTVSYGQIVEIRSVPGGTGSGFIILIDGRRQN